MAMNAVLEDRVGFYVVSGPPEYMLVTDISVNELMENIRRKERL